MSARTTTLSALAVAALAIAALTGCAEEEFLAGGGGSSSEVAEEAPADDIEAAPASSGLEQAAADGMPGLPITGCDELDEYGYSPFAGNTQWKFQHRCTDRSAFDETTSALIAAGFTNNLSEQLGTEDYLSDWNHFMLPGAELTEVDLKLTGPGERLKYVVLVTVTPN